LSLFGTYPFAAVTPRDDVISLGYVLVWCMKGSLPWEAATSADEVLRIKRSTPLSTLCEGLPGTSSAVVTRFPEVEVEVCCVACDCVGGDDHGSICEALRGNSIDIPSSARERVDLDV
jgi:hypothetical protein